MIRFIDLGKQIRLDDDCPREFCFYNTVSDRFIDFNGSQVWDSWKGFEEDYKTDDWRLAVYTGRVSDIDRYRDLCPEWVFESEDV